MHPLKIAIVGIAMITASGASAQTGTAEFWARVDANGVTTAGSGVTSTTRSGIGRYIFTFARSVGTCVWTSNAVTAVSYYTSVRLAVGGNNLVVQAFRAGGQAVDVPVNVRVHCQD